MNTIRKLDRVTLPLTVGRTKVTVSCLHRDGPRTPLVFLHGFGSTKEDYADVVHQAGLDGHAVLAYDAPGCGASTCDDLEAISIPFLVDVAAQVLRTLRMDRYHLFGHSMGGLTALLLADENPGSMESLTSIEGNLAPEDCFLSRQTITHPSDDPEEFLADFTDRVSGSRFAASALYSASLAHKVRAAAVAPIFRSMVALSDHGRLLDRFLALPAPTMFMYGSQNDSLSYLDKLAAEGVELAEISRCAHFPMYSNPTEMWDRITRFVTRTNS